MNGKNTTLQMAAGASFSAAELEGGNENTVVERLQFDYNYLGNTFVIGHEWTHTTMQRLGGPLRSGGLESIALNEGFCDIFGSLVSGLYQGLGRNLVSPTSTGDIDHYSNLDISNTGESASGHRNSTILSKVYHLLAAGGVHYGTTVASISVEKTKRLVFDVMTNKLEGAISFAMCRDKFVLSAIQLFGPCSEELKQVTNAWFSVGVGAKWNDDSWVSGNVVICKENNGVGLSLSACNGSGANNNANYEWVYTPNSQWHVTISGPYKSTLSIHFITYPQYDEKVLIRVKSPSGIWTDVWVYIKNCASPNPDPCDPFSISSRPTNIEPIIQAKILNL